MMEDLKNTTAAEKKESQESRQIAEIHSCMEDIRGRILLDETIMRAGEYWR